MAGDEGGSALDRDARTEVIAPETEDDAAPRARSRAPADPAIGSTQGRYVVLEVIGRGAMGRVLRAYDPVLQREVALKLVSSRTLDPNARERMLREARAMAQLSHPNVVAVYDAEDSDAGVVLVMEYVRGATLRAWVDAARRPWAEIVARFVDAGRGLGAAHAAGLLHRDFKPDNVLVSESGAVKVTDFGLAKLASASARSLAGLDASASGSLDASSSGLGALDGSTRGSGTTGAGDSAEGVLTRVGTVMGTPRYMAPEQHRGDLLDPSADQYAFCVALWEALAGAPPHPAKRLDELFAAKLRPPPPWPASAPAAPRAVVEALRRGMAPHPLDRFPGMDALLGALDRDPARRRGRVLAGVGAVALVAVGGAGAWSWAAARAERCSGAEAQLQGVWDDARREQVRAALLDAGASYAEPVWARTEGQLDRYAHAWAGMHAEACEATTVRGEQSAEVLDLRMACLHRARLGLEAVTRVLAHADAEVTRNAHDVVGSLPALERCADVAALRADVEPPSPAEAPAVEAAVARLAEAEAESEAGRYARALERVEEARAALDDVAYGPVRTELALAEGGVLEALGRYDQAEAALRRGLASGARFRQWELVQDAAQGLMSTVGYHERRMAEGLQLWDLALGLAEGDAEREGSARNIHANVLYAEGSLAEAEAEYRRALALWESALGPDDPDVAVAHNNLSLVLGSLGRYDEAEAEARRGLAVMQAAHGSRHPATALFRNNLANPLAALGRYGEAEEELRDALALLEELLGPEHPDVALTTSNLAQIFVAQSRLPEAEALHRQALAIHERVLGPTHPSVGQSLNNLALVLYPQARFVEAEAALRRALPILEGALGPGHPEVAQLRGNLGLVLHAQGKLAPAEAELRQALAAWESAVGPDHASVGLVRNNLGLVLYGKGDYAEAEALTRQSLAVQEQQLGADHPNVATTRSNLAQILLDAGRVDEAEAEHRKALAVQEQVQGPEHPDVARAYNNLGQILSARGAKAEAEQALRRALEGWERSLGADHPNVALVRHNLASLVLEGGREREALPLAEAAWARRDRDDIPPEPRGDTAFLLARTLWALGQRPRARQLAARALEWYGVAERPDDVASVQAWLEAPQRWRPRSARGSG